MKNFIVIEGGYGNVFTNARAEGEFEVAIDIVNSSGNSFHNTYLDVKGNQDNAGISRNQKCPCGSGIRYRKCHGVKKLGTGIRVEGHGNDFGGSTVFADGDGIIVKGNDNKFPNVKVFSTSDGLAQLIATLNLPTNTPVEYLKEVIEAFGENKEIKTSDDFQLKAWLFDNGFNFAYWTQLLQSMLPLLAGSNGG